MEALAESEWFQNIEILNSARPWIVHSDKKPVNYDDENA